MEDFKDLNPSEQNTDTDNEVASNTEAFDKDNDVLPEDNEAFIQPENTDNIEDDKTSLEDISEASAEDSEQSVSEVEEATQPEQVYNLPYSPINFTPVVPMENKKPMSRGLKFFALLLAGIIALTMACAGGYFLGKISSGKKEANNDKGIINLEAQPADSDELTPAQVYEKVNASVVGICVYNKEGKASNATGVIYSEEGYIITNDHIYSEITDPKFKIYTHDNKEFNAEYIAGDVVSDLAVLKIHGSGFKKAAFANSEQVFFGQNVVAVGRPGGAANASSITKGVISATSRRVQTTSSYSARLIETDCPINPGSSGGALVNMYGQVVGITSSKLASADIDAVGYAIPTTTVKRIIEELIENGKVLSRAKLGITYRAIDSVYAETKGYKFKGLYVDSVAEDSDLYQKISEGDIITRINDIEVTRDDIVLDIIEKSKAGDTIKVTFVDKNGKEATVDAVLKANIGESSYNKNKDSDIESLPQLPENGKGEGGKFDFPFGE